MFGIRERVFIIFPLSFSLEINNRLTTRISLARIDIYKAKELIMIFWKKQPTGEDNYYNKDVTNKHQDIVAKVFYKKEPVLIGDDAYLTSWKGVNVTLVYGKLEIKVTYSIPGFPSREITTNDFRLGLAVSGAENYFYDMFKLIGKEKEQLERRISSWGLIHRTHFISNGEIEVDTVDTRELSQFKPLSQP